MRKTYLAFVVFVFYCFQLSSACHNAYHKAEASTNPDGSRRRRDTNRTGDTNITVQTFFPLCLHNQLTATNYNNRSWVGPINFIIFHSSWYKRINGSMCTGNNDTVECWAENVGSFIRQRSPAFRASQDCIVQYYNTYHGENFTLSDYPDGSDFEEGENCTEVDVESYQTEFLTDFNNQELETEDLTLTDFDDLLHFAEDDLICPDCTCDDLEDNDKYFEEFDIEGVSSCNECWYTRLATEFSEDSKLKGQASKLARSTGKLKQNKVCPKPDLDFSSENVVANILGINVTCDLTKVIISMESCGLVQMGYFTVDEVFISNPTVSSIAEDVGMECFPKLKKRSENDKIVVFAFKKERCDGLLVKNDTHSLYTYAIRNRHAEDLYSVEVIDTHVGLDINITCVYGDSTVSLPFAIQTLTRTVSIQLTEKHSSLALTMAAYRDPDFTQPLTEQNSSVNIPDMIWIKLSHNEGDDVIPHLENCWAAPTEAPDDPNKVYLVFLGCPEKEQNGTGTLDAAKNLSTCANRDASFGFGSFAFSGLPTHISCDVEVYISNTEGELPCAMDTCDDQPSTQRRRRNVRNRSIQIQLPIATVAPHCSRASGDCTQISFGCNESGEQECRCFSGYFLQQDRRTCAQR